MTDFVDLNRCFVKIRKDQEPNLDIGRVWGRKIGGWLEWTDLLKCRRVVLLAEASSGKTEEFRNKAIAVSNGGQEAFFVRIEELADQDFERALDLTALQRFLQWREATEPGWFFLDSVDEARLNRKSFEAALRRFARELGQSLSRAHVLISCRVTDWKGREDRIAIERLLPIGVSEPEKAAEKDEESSLLDPMFERVTGTKKQHVKESDEHSSDETVVVQLVPLSAEQRRSLASASGKNDYDAFTSSIDRNGLDILAERPGDLLDLAEYWKTFGCFGRFEVMVEHGVTQKLAERDKYRPDNDALTPQQARQGAERIAAALTLGKSFTLLAPGYEPDPTTTGFALDPAVILDDCTDAARNTLARRGVFAPSTYGRIRFHHRCTQEYLTARWFDRLLRSGCARSEVWNLIFADRYGVETVVPSLRPAAAWLALWHPEIREEIIRREPLVLLRHGDPSSLPLESKRRLLRTYATKHAAGDIADDGLDHKALWMFADHGLADTIREAWCLNERSDFRDDLLRLIREGKILSCTDLARRVAFDETADDYARITALDALNECGDVEGLSEVARRLLLNPAEASARIAPRFASVLFPRHIDTAALVALIARSRPARQDTVEGFAHKITDFWNACPDADSRNQLAAGLAELCLEPPFAADHLRVSKAHLDLAKHLAPIVRSAVQELGDRDPPAYLVRLIMAVERADRDRDLEDRPHLHQLIRANAKLHRMLFWADAEEVRQNSKHEDRPIRYWQIHFGGSCLWDLGHADLPWLLFDLTKRESIADQRIALSAIVPIYARDRCLDEQVPRLRELIVGRRSLEEDLSEYLAPPSEDAEERRLRRQERAHESDRDKKEKRRRHRG